MLASALLTALPALVAAQSGAVVTLNGDVWDGNGGPLATGTVYHITSAGSCCVRVPAGRTLTVQTGAIVKIDSSILVDGTLIARNADFTSWLDDTIGGDSNGDGNATLPGRGDWDRIEVRSGGSALVEDSRLTWGGSASGSPNGAPFVARAGASSAVLRRCRIRYSGSHGASLEEQAVTIDHCAFEDGDGIAIFGADLRELPLLTDNTAARNRRGDHVRVTRGTTPWVGTLRLDARHSPNGSGLFVCGPALFSGFLLRVPLGATLQLPAGTVMKFERSQVTVDGELRCDGTAATPVALTSLFDDAIGGDTQRNGSARTPSPGDWSGIGTSGAGSRLTLTHTRIHYGGSSSQGAVFSSSATSTLIGCEIAHAGGSGLHQQGGSLTFADCTIRDCRGAATRDLTWDTVAASTRNHAFRNVGGDHLQILSGLLLRDAIIGPEHLTNGVLRLDGNSTVVTAGVRLALGSGTILKPAFGRALLVQPGGRLDLLGTGHDPVVVTSLKDDQFGGDTNADGPSAGAPGDVGAVDLPAGAAGTLEHVVLRFGGSQALGISSAAVTAAAVRVQEALGTGMQVAALGGQLAQCVAWACGGDGIRVTGGSFPILFATSVGNAGGGIVRAGPHTGTVHAAVAWSNGGGQLPGFPASDVFGSIGAHAGINGNIVADPLLEAPAQGVLWPTASSPALDTGDVGLALLLRSDADDASRITDGASTGTLLPDRGAYERTPFRLFVTGRPFGGDVLDATCVGPTGLWALLLGFQDGVIFVPPFGFELAGILGLTALNPIPLGVNGSYPVALPPDPALRGVPFALQAIALPTLAPGTGAFSNVYRATIL